MVEGWGRERQWRGRMNVVKGWGRVNISLISLFPPLPATIGVYFRLSKSCVMVLTDTEMTDYSKLCFCANLCFFLSFYLSFLLFNYKLHTKLFTS